jgi:Mg-chelatase subunit ChlD
MSLRQYVRELGRSAPSWALSLAFHVAILLSAGMISWVIIRARAPDVPLMLRQPEAGAQEVVEGPGGNAGGDLTPSERAPAPSPKAALVSAAPAPVALARALTEPLAPASGDLLAAATDPADELARALAASPTGIAAPGGGPGIGLLDGTSPGFGQHIGALRGAGLDVVLVLDATDSMTPYIEQAKKRLQQVLDVVTGLVPAARVGMVAYKDYGDEYGPNAVRSTPITADVAVIRKFINDTMAGGGADIPEPIHEAVKVAVSVDRMGWRRTAKRVVILVGDSPCHTSGRAEAFAAAAAFAKQGGTINVIDTGGAAGEKAAARKGIQPDLQRIAQDGGGEAFLLKDTDAFWRYLIVSIFGQRYEQDVGIIIKKLIREE